VLHTTRGIPVGDDVNQFLKLGLGPNHKRDEKIPLMWSFDDRNAGAHLICDSDASWVNTCDLQNTAAYHAGDVNDYTIGIEIYQEPDTTMYEDQLLSVVTMVDVLTRIFSIQRQFHGPYEGQPIQRGLDGGKDMVGIYGHRDCSNNRGFGDPGDHIFKMLGAAGYEQFDFGAGQDLEVWKDRQQELGLTPDGIPGPDTCAALLEAGYDYGLWVQGRPTD
jgi:hypothetical protein